LEADAREVEFRVAERMDAAAMEAFVADVKAFLAAHKITQAQLAKWINNHHVVVSQFLSGKYEGDLEKIAAKIAGVLNTVARKKRQAGREGYIETGTAKRIGTLITEVQAFGDEEGRIGLVIGDSGHGKSVCLRAYAAADKNSLYIVYDDTMRTLQLFAEIARLLKVNAVGSLAELADRVVKAVKARHLLVLIDEASSMDAKLLNRLRQVLVAKAGCSLILAGNAELLRTIRDTGRAAGAESLDQFNGRLMSVLNLDELAADPDDPLYTADDVERLYSFGGIKLSRDAVDALRRLLSMPRSGRLRTAGTIIAALHMSAVIVKRGVIDAEAILSAAAELALPVCEMLPVVCRDARHGMQAAAVG
jgi:hypothetical protein